MNKLNIETNQQHSLLLEQFNKRERTAFGQIYSMYYEDFHRYTLYLYRNIEIDSNDIIQDIFLYLWEKSNIQFDNIIKIKGFIIISIKNGYKNYMRHAKHERKYNEIIYSEKDFEDDVLKFELYSLVHEALHILPKECAEILKLYLDGYKPEEISIITGKQPQTIYNKKQKAISILRRKLTKEMLAILLSL